MELTELFPACFAPKGAPKRPIKIGIHRDILERRPSLRLRDVRFALSDYTGGALYLTALMTCDTRYDLDGRPAGSVTSTAAAAAADALERMKKNNLRQAASRPERNQAHQ